MGMFSFVGDALGGLFGDAPEALTARLSALTRSGKFGLRGHV